MYVILIKNDNTLVASQVQSIMHRSKLVDDLCFLVEPIYNGYNMADFTVYIEYLLPVSKRYKTEVLTQSKEPYKNHLKYLLPIDTCITSEVGEVELQLSFVSVDLDISGNSIQRVRKTSAIAINVLPVSAWSDVIPDEALTSLDQRIIKIDSQIKALNNVGNKIIRTKADNFIYSKETKEFQLTADGKAIGDKAILDSCSCEEDGVPIVEFYGKVEGLGDVDVVLF